MNIRPTSQAALPPVGASPSDRPTAAATGFDVALAAADGVQDAATGLPEEGDIPLPPAPSLAVCPASALPEHGLAAADRTATATIDAEVQPTPGDDPMHLDHDLDQDSVIQTLLPSAFAMLLHVAALQFRPLPAERTIGSTSDTATAAAPGIVSIIAAGGDGTTQPFAPPPMGSAAPDQRHPTNAPPLELPAPPPAEVLAPIDPVSAEPALQTAMSEPPVTMESAVVLPAAGSIPSAVTTPRLPFVAAAPVAPAPPRRSAERELSDITAPHATAADGALPIIVASATGASWGSSPLHVPVPQLALPLRPVAPPEPPPKAPSSTFAIDSVALGGVEVGITPGHRSAERLAVHFAVERAATATLIAESSEQLDRALAAAGARLDSLSVAPRSEPTTGFGQRDPGSDAPRRDPRPPPRRPPPPVPTARVEPRRDRFA